MTKLKKCTKCCKEKPYSEFTKDKQKSDGHRSDCKSCRYQKNKEIIKHGFKKCTGKGGCGKIKKLCEFSLRGDTDKYRGQCKECRRLYHKEYNIKHRDEKRSYKRAWGEKNKKKNFTTDPYNTNVLKKCWCCDRSKSVMEFNRDGSKNDGLSTICRCCNKIKNKEYRSKNLNERRRKDKEYKRINRHKVCARYNYRYKNDPVFKLKENLRNRTKLAIKGHLSSGTILEYLGCSIEELKQYLENQFYNNPETGEEMTWQNHSLYGWHIDHVIPWATVKDSNDNEQIKKVCHYTNLQPLWAEENLKKGDKYDE